MVKCSVCGAPVEGDRCEYCGFQVEKKRRRQEQTRRADSWQAPYQQASRAQEMEQEIPYTFGHPQTASSYDFPEQRSYSEWLDRLPGFVKKMIKKHGWLYGVYMAFCGGLLIFVGFILRIIGKQTIARKFDAFGFDENTFFYLPTGTDPFVDAANSTWTRISAISLVAIICGLLIMTGGIALARGLKKWGRRL